MSRLCGVGLALRDRGDVLEVEGVLEGSPAQLCGSERQPPSPSHHVRISRAYIFINFWESNSLSNPSILCGMAARCSCRCVSLAGGPCPRRPTLTRPVARAEVLKGDIVMAVNGIACGVRHGLTLEKVKPLILGKPGTVVSRLPVPHDRPSAGAQLSQTIFCVIHPCPDSGM